MRVIAYMPVAKLSADIERRPVGGFAAESVLVRLRGMVAPRLHDGDNLVELGSLNQDADGFPSAAAPSGLDVVVAGDTQVGNPALIRSQEGAPFSPRSGSASL